MILRRVVSTVKFGGREAEFQRKSIPGENTVDLADYLPQGWR